MSCRHTLWCHILVWLLTIQESSSGTVLWMSLLAFFFLNQARKSMLLLQWMELLLAPTGVLQSPWLSSSHSSFSQKFLLFKIFFDASKILLSLSLSCCLLFLRQLQCFFSFTNGRDASAMFHSPNASEYYSKRCRLLRC